MRYFVKRLIWIIPMLCILTVCISLLTSLVPEQQIAQIIENQRGPQQSSKQDYFNTARLLQLDKPLFYFSIVPMGYPDTLFHLPYSTQYNNIKGLFYGGMKWRKIELFRKQIGLTYSKVLIYDDFEEKKEILQRIARLKDMNTIVEIDAAILLLGKNKILQISSDISSINTFWQNAKSETRSLSLLLPTFKWHGSDNQYSIWINQILQLNFGTSSIDDRPVTSKISQALKWTLSISTLALFIIFLIAIPLGLNMAIHKNSRRDKWISFFVFVLYSIPTFWLATILIVFFTSNRYCAYCDIFPSIGLIHISEGESFLQAFFSQFAYFILPILCLVPGSIAYVYRQMRSNTINELDRTYIQAAKAKGLSKATITWKYIFPNAVYPLIPLLTSILPGIITGSLIVEFIFNIPGMGRLMYESILHYDWPVIKIILLLLGLVTLLAFFITDLVYKWVDPRIKFGK